MSQSALKNSCHWSEFTAKKNKPFHRILNNDSLYVRSFELTDLDFHMLKLLIVENDNVKCYKR